MLRVSDLSFSYGRGRNILEGVSMEVERGDLVGILGPNGSGKTTLLKVLCGALTPTSGAVLLEDRPVGDWPRQEIAQRVALVPQETNAAFDFSVLDIVLMGRFPYLGPFRARRSRRPRHRPARPRGDRDGGVRRARVRDSERR